MAMEYGKINKQMLSPESAAAGDIFDQFANAQTFKSVQGTFRLLCDTLRLKPTNFPNFYPKLKAKLRSWKAQAIWSKFDKRAAHRCYNRGKSCANVKVLIIGAGPCGLRTAIEAQLLGAKVVVIEKRDRFSRNNVLHLWPFVIQDLRNLGAKKFYGKFCAGAIDHISIRQLQCILLKVALLLGVEVHENVTFDDLIEPPIDQSQEKIGWRALVTPREHPLSLYEFDVLIGADGKRNTVKGFKRKEFRGKLAIAITANFINRHSEAEARVQEISGVAFIFNQKFFQDLRDHTGIDLENIVYYKDETHYFVMTAKKYSLIEKGVILNDHADTARLLSPDNVSKDALFNYAREAADFSTNFQMPNLDFAVNHYGQEDVAMFDFTSMYAAESACRVIERKGHKLLQALVGDSLLEPFWPTGSGCARGFLSSMDTCWMIRSWALGTMTSLQVLAERESIFRLLAQTTPENLSKDYNDYSLNPASRYPNLNSSVVRPVQVKALYDTDGEIKDEPLDIFELPKKKRKRDSLIHPETLLNWCQRQVVAYNNVSIDNMTSSWKNGLALAAILHRYRPDLIDFNSLASEDEEKNNQLVFDIFEREFAIHPVITAKEISDGSAPDVLAMVSYISQIYETFRGEIPHVARTPMVDLSPEDRPASPSRKSPIARLSFLSRLGQRLGGSKKRYSLERAKRADNDKELERERADILRRIKKRRSLERDRALFIMNKDANQPTSYKRTVTTIEDRENFTTRVKDLEEKLYGVGRQTVLATSPNAPRVIGKLDRGDWNVRMLEEKLKGQRPSPKRERQDVPKWNRDMFEDKLRALDRRGKGENPTEQAKYSAFDSCLQLLDKKLKEGNNLEIGQRGSNKVSTVAGQLSSILDTNTEPIPLQRSNSKPCMINTQSASETCHFCSKRIYLMERQSTHGKFFHRGCFKCECCGIALRLSSYGIATVGPYNGKFLCLLHCGMRNPPRRNQTDGKKGSDETIAARTSVISNTLDLPDVCSNKMRGITPERAEFENTIEFTSEEELLSEIDEDEWTDRNFGMSANEYESSDEESDLSSDEMASENEVELEEAFQNSLTANETLKLAETWKRRYFKKKATNESGITKEGDETDDEDDDDDDDDEDYDESEEEYSYEEYENEDDDDDDDDDDDSTATEGESQDVAGDAPEQHEALPPRDYETINGEISLTIPQAILANISGESSDYQALKSSETGTEETGSDDIESEDFTDSDTETESERTPEEDVDDERKGLDGQVRFKDQENHHRSRRCSATIPIIVIDETTAKAPDEDDDAYFVTLQQQSLIAERTLENLIIHELDASLPESAIQTPDDAQFGQEDIRPLVTTRREMSSYKLESEALESGPATREDSVPECNGETREILLPELVQTTEPDAISTSELIEGIEKYAILESAIAKPTNKDDILMPAVAETDDKDSISKVVEIKEHAKIENEISVLPVRSLDNRYSGPPDCVQISNANSDRAPTVHAPTEELTSLADINDADEKIESKEKFAPALVATESPTAKMMLKLKEQYLLGNCGGCNSDDKSATPNLTVPANSNEDLHKTLEPAVKSCLELITEKQRMLSQAISPPVTSSFRLGGLAAVDTAPISPLSTVSASSESSQPKMSDSSSTTWSKISPISPLENACNQLSIDGYPISDECGDLDTTACSPDLFDAPLSSKSTSSTVDEEPCNSSFEYQATKGVAARDNDDDDDDDDECRQEVDDLKTPLEEILEIKGPAKEDVEPNQASAEEITVKDAGIKGVMDRVEDASFDESFCRRPAEDDGNGDDDDNDNTFFKNIDFSNVTLRKKLPMAAQRNNDVKETLTPVENLVYSSEFQQETIPTLTMPDNQDLKESPVVVAAVSDRQEAVEIGQLNEKSNEEERTTHLAKPEDDDSLMMGMSNSSDSDAFPSLDEKIYNSVEIKKDVDAPKMAAYAGFSERIFPFGGSVVRDSLTTKRLSPFAETPKEQLIDSADLMADAKAATNRPAELSLSPSKEVERNERNNEVTRSDKIDVENSKGVETLEEIPFADDESSHHSSGSSPDKKDPFFVAQRKFKRSLQRPLSMVETLLCSTSTSPPPPTSSSHSTKRWMLPDTPFTNPDMMNTPKTMKEAVDDLRQIRTVEREKARQEARERARLKSDEELGLQKVDYTVLKKKYSKLDGKLDFNIEEESGPRSSSSNGDDDDHDDRCHVELQADTSSSQQLPTVHSSSSPDSEVFEQDIELVASAIDKADTPELAEKESDIGTADVELVQSCSLDTNSASSSGKANCSQSEATKSESNASTSSSKTDHPSSYLEPDLAIDELCLTTTTTVVPTENPSPNLSREGVIVVVASGSSSSSKKDKQKRKSFLSLFSNFGKGKEKESERKSKEKSSSPPSISSPPHQPQPQSGEITPATPLSPLECSSSSGGGGGGGSLRVDGVPKESRFPKLRLARSKEKIKEKQKEKEASLQSSKEGSCSPFGSSQAMQLHDADLVFDKGPHSSTRTLQSGDISITLDMHSLIASMASISKEIPTCEKVTNGVALQAAEDNTSDNDANNGSFESASDPLTSSSKKVKDVADDRRKKLQKIAQRVYRQQEQKRLRMAQEIQRQLEELEIKQRDMESRGVQVEKALRGEGDAARKEEAELMQEWFQLVNRKNMLVRQEQELMVKAKELELEVRHSRLQNKLHERMAIDDIHKTPAEIEEEGQILTEMLDIVEQRDSLIALLEESRQRHQDEDKDLEYGAQVKVTKLLPTSN